MEVVEVWLWDVDPESVRSGSVMPLLLPLQLKRVIPFHHKSMMPLPRARCEFPRIPYFRDRPKRGTSNTPTMNLAGMRRAKWAKKYHFGGP
jgi:hypothetical protein